VADAKIHRCHLVEQDGEGDAVIFLLVALMGTAYYKCQSGLISDRV
jgi:hypothetical protein